jgi:hypothetical protein
MKQFSVRASQALGFSVTLLGAAGHQAQAASIDAAPGFFFSSLPFNDTGTTVGAVSDFNSIPAGISKYTTVNGPDVFYLFSVLTPGTMTFTVTPLGGTGFDPAIYLMAGLSGTSANAFIGKDEGLGNIQESFTTGVLPIGVYIFAIDSFYNTGTVEQPNRMSGAYSLSVSGTALLGAVPEPSAPAMALAAAGAVGWRRRRQGGR